MNVVALLFENKQPFAVGHNDPPKIRLVKTGKTPLGSKTYDTYDVFVGERKVGMAFGRYMPKKPGMAAGHIFRMTLKGQVACVDREDYTRRHLTLLGFFHT
jgi:hypothetical protein